MRSYEKIARLLILRVVEVPYRTLTLTGQNDGKKCPHVTTKNPRGLASLAGHPPENLCDNLARPGSVSQQLRSVVDRKQNPPPPPRRKKM